MNINAKSIVKTKSETSTLRKAISSMIFGALAVFLIFNTVQSTGVIVEASFLKSWIGATAGIFLIRKYLF